MGQLVGDIRVFWEELPRGAEDFDLMMRLLHHAGDRLSHVGTFETVQFLCAPEGRLTIHLGPSKKWVPQALFAGAWAYWQTVDLAAEHFEGPDLDSWRRRSRLLIDRCRTVTRDQARDVGRNDPCPCGSGFKFKRCHADILV